MASMPLALSVHSLVNSVGADAGFAAVVGLAILALLYFAHARETANLREEAAMLAQRLQDAEARLDAARRAAPAQLVPRAAPAPAALRAVAQTPFAPAGLAAPELASATRFIPVSAAPAVAAVGVVSAASSLAASRVAGTAAPAAVPPGQPETAQEPEDQGEPSAPVSADPAPPGAAPPVTAPPPVRSPAPAPAAVTAFRTAPATVAGAASSGQSGEDVGNGASAAPVGVIDQPAPSASPPPPAAPPARAQRPIIPPDQNLFVSERTRHGPPIGRRFAVLVGILVVIGAVAAVVIATSGTGTQNASNGSGAGGAPTRPTPSFNPALITVAVLNGTNTNQLAHHVADRLAGLGYKEGAIATASNQTLTSTIVGYQPGASNRTAALHIAKTLKLPARSVAPVDPAARTVACPPPSACTANVIVTVGANLAAAY